MLVYRVENIKGYGPVYGVKDTEVVHYDYSNNPRYIESMKKIKGQRGVILTEDDIKGSYVENIPYDSKDVIIDHKTPRENKPYFHNQYCIGTFGYYRFGDNYSFGWKTFKQCKNFVQKGKKKKWILHKEGFFISEYHTNDFIIFPDGQIAFDKKKAKLVKCHRNQFI